MSHRVLFLIPARGGSARVPRKNLRTVGGVPLVARAVGVAREVAAGLSGGPHRIVASTDDPQIAAVAAAAGAEIIDRPAELATGTASSVDVALHALDVVGRGATEPPDILVLLQPTSPLTGAADVLAALEAFEAGGRTSAASVTASHPASWHVTGGGGPGDVFARAAGDDATRLLTGAIYVIAPDRLRTTRRFVDSETIAVPIPRARSVDVDEPEDLVIAEALLAAGPESAIAGIGRDPVEAAERPARASSGVRQAAVSSTASRPPGEGRRRIAILTTGRQDWGILRSTAVAVRDDPSLDLVLLAGGMHLSERHGATVEQVRADGFEPDELLDWLGGAAGGKDDDGGARRGSPDEIRADPPADEQAAGALAAVGAALRRRRPDALVLAGDRFETAAAALAATVNVVPIVHVHGGEQTFGAFDDALRHAITKLAHLHLVSRDEHRARLIAMGEDPAAIHVVGSPGLDALGRPDLPDRAELERELGLELRPPVVVVTVHPATLDANPAADAAAVAAAMDAVEGTYVVTLPNVDPGADAVLRILEAAADRAPRAVAVRALGERRYWGLLGVADAMLGNSSSGIAEAPAIGLPAVNVGDRQAGRHRAANVIDAPPEPEAVTAALRRALDPAFRRGLPGPDGPPPDGRAGQRIAHIISAWHPSRPPRKAPIDVPR